WAFALAKHPGGWENVYDCTLGQVVGRVVGDSAVGPHSHPVWYYFVGGWGSVLPWVTLLPAILAVPAARRRLARRPLLDAALVFRSGLLLVSIPSGKRISYLSPLLPIAAAIPADWIARLRPHDRFGTKWLRFVVALAAVVGGALAGLAFTLAAGRAFVHKL